MIERISNFCPFKTATSISAYADPRSDFERLSKLTFHIESGDYFRSLAALLGFIEETLVSEDSDESKTIQLEAIRASRKDLLYLDGHCSIGIRPLQCSCATLSE